MINKEELVNTLKNTILEFVEYHKGSDCTDDEQVNNCYDEMIKAISEATGIDDDHPLVIDTALALLDAYIEFDADSEEGPCFPLCWVDSYEDEE